MRGAQRRRAHSFWNAHCGPARAWSAWRLRCRPRASSRLWSTNRSRAPRWSKRPGSVRAVAVPNRAVAVDRPRPRVCRPVDGPPCGSRTYCCRATLPRPAWSASRGGLCARSSRDRRRRHKKHIVECAPSLSPQGWSRSRCMGRPREGAHFFVPRTHPSSRLPRAGLLYASAAAPAELFEQWPYVQSLGIREQRLLYAVNSLDCMQTAFHFSPRTAKGFKRRICARLPSRERRGGLLAKRAPLQAARVAGRYVVATVQSAICTSAWPSRTHRIRAGRGSAPLTPDGTSSRTGRQAGS